MAQIPISDKVFADLFELKNESIKARMGKAVTWYNVIDAIVQVIKNDEKNKKAFLNIMQKFEARKHEK